MQRAICAFARIAQQLAGWTEDDRQLLGNDLEAVDQGRRARIVGGIELLVRVAVAAQEIDQPKDVRIAFRTDDDRTGAGFDQADAAKDQGAHDALAKIGLGDQQRAQPLGRNGHRLDVGQRGCVDEVGAAR